MLVNDIDCNCYCSLDHDNKFGWSCLDAKNSEYVGKILKYAKEYFCHVITIYLTDEMEDLVDHQLRISVSEGGKSCVKIDK